MSNTRMQQAQLIADILSSARVEHRTVADIEGLTGLCHEYVKAWFDAFEAVGMMERITVERVSARNGRSYKSQAWKVV